MFGEWQDIETAPKDGTDVLFYLDKRPPWVAGWNQYAGEWQDFDGECVYGIGGCPTHWMPLPKPPEAS